MKKELSKEEYGKALEELSKVSSAKEARAYHKKYRKYGLGLLFYSRYPNFPLIVAAIALAVSILALIYKIALQ